MRLSLNLLCLVLVTGLAASAQVGGCNNQSQTCAYVYGPLSGAQKTPPADVARNVVPHRHSVSFNITGSPTTCTIALEGAPKRFDDPTLVDADFQSMTGDLDCTTLTSFSIVNRVILCWRVNLKVISGGTSPKITINYLGER